MKHTPPRALAPSLAAGGLVLFLGAFVWALTYIMRPPPPLVNGMIWAGLVLGLALQVGAVGVSLWGAYRRGGIPAVASLYGLAALVAAGAWAYERFETRQWYRDNPEAFTIEWNEEGTEVGVRTGDGVWWTPLDECPGAGSDPMLGLGSVSRNGYADVEVQSDRPHMRLHIADRRVECLLTDLPLSRADLSRALATALDVDALRSHLPEDSTLLLMGGRLPPMDSVRVDGRPVRVTDRADANVIEIRLLDPQPDRVTVDLEIYQEGVSAQIASTRTGEGPWTATVQSLSER